MRLVLIAVLLFSGRISISAQTRDRSLYLVADGSGRWCGFRTEKLWTAEKESLASAPLVARVDYANGRVAFVYVTNANESGDWTTYDKYSFDKNEILTSLERTIVIPDGLRQEQLWSIRNGHATEQKSTNRNLVTNETFPDGKISIPDTEEVITRIQAFPFWPLIHDKRPEVASSGKACTESMETAH
jgi:hypothetical protein